MLGREKAMKAKGLALLLAALSIAAVAAVVAACETEAPFAPCELDVEVTSKNICSGTGGDTSCVVTKHPHCTQDICLSYYGKSPVCTQTCTSNFDCPTDSFCWTFAEEKGEKYCVPNSLK
jgi:hypothetical protein